LEEDELDPLVELLVLVPKLLLGGVVVPLLTPLLFLFLLDPALDRGMELMRPVGDTNLDVEYPELDVGAIGLVPVE
jgi:hypothetical protein